MGFLSPTLPDTDLAEWRRSSYQDRLRVQVQHWAEYGFGTPWGVFILYIVKMAAYLVLPAWIISATTPGLGTLGEIGSWWTEPIVFQKFVIFTILFEVLGFGCGSGPLTMRFFPPVGGFIYWLRPGTLRMPPWPGKVPLTRGDKRTLVDVALYLLVIGALVWGLAGDTVAGGTRASGLVAPSATALIVASLAVIGLRDKTIFLAARADQYWIMAIAFLFPFTDMIIALKLIMIAVWWGAATSKLNHHFPFVVSVMLSNSPALRSKWLKRKLFRRFPDDVRPSGFAKAAAHTGTVIEYCVPLVLLFSTNTTVTLLACAAMTIFHLFILSTFPAGVPLEWNLFVIIGAWLLFGHYGGTQYALSSVTSPWLIAALLVPVVVMIGIGNFKPEWISFLPGMRYYAGNWATSMWIMRPGVEETLDAKIVKSARLQKWQLMKLYDEGTSEFMMQKFLAWRSMHSHGRALVGLLPRAVTDPDAYVIREGEFLAGALLGWNFGEGHLHDEQLVEAVQKRCQFAPGDLRVIMLEGQPAHTRQQRYRIVDAATGLREEGIVRVSEMIVRQPWLDHTRTIPVQVISGGVPAPAASAATIPPASEVEPA
ncbi:DUF3556 domain-containing protein [Streptomyces sp. NPDC005336]|uniref:DUF3556 domain-containing protein n=1 Tax=unclassified Streptomyces TaxID=2593676 RepID=UPI0033BF6AAD